ncbi:tetratricopeptide repeat protein [Maricaulis parjimensis]|uniref:tetratricopeptide repeat protein n=1 Tax=Maricaulis parjimensis TaxID=144023 RepID=UPI00193A51FD|nr:tetratricopeptide repeat protein [Maricaulis parjimensis]
MMRELQIAAQLLQQGRPEEAIARLDAILAQYPQEPEALHLRGLARGRAGQFEGALADFQAAAVRHSQPHAVLSNLGNLKRRAGDLEGALAAYEAALEKQPSFADARVNMGITLTDLRRFSEAAAAFEAVIRQQPGHTAALNGLGIVLTHQGDEDGALEAYSQCVSANSGVIMPRINRGALLRGRNQADASLADLEEACRLAPRLAEAHFQRGHTLRTLGQTEAAREAYRQAVSCAPQRADIHRDLAGLLWEMGEGEGSTAVLDQALAQQPTADLFHTRARVLMRTGRPEAALEAASEALALDARHADAKALRGEILGKLGDPGIAINEIRAALDMSDGKDFAIRHQLAEACLAAGRYDEAEQALDAVPPAEHLQKHVALQVTAWRCLGDERYKRFYDYDLLTAKRFIETPPGFQSLDAFNAELAARIEHLHSTRVQPIEQTLFGGTQSPGRLWDVDDPVIQALGTALLDMAKRFVSELPDDPDHPFLCRKSDQLKLTGAWSVRLTSGGGHVDHIHPAGWISASYYVQVPQAVAEGERAGWLRLGVPGVAGLELDAERYILPEAGSAILFPSYMWHGVEPFEADEVRVTAPFDLLPV